MKTENEKLIEYINEKNYTDLFIINRTKISIGKREFSTKVNLDSDFKYVLLYVENLKLWLCWKRRDKRIEIYNSQQSDVLEHSNKEIDYFIKNKEFSGWGQEKVYVIKPAKIKEFIDKLSQNETIFF